MVSFGQIELDFYDITVKLLEAILCPFSISHNDDNDLNIISPIQTLRRYCGQPLLIVSVPCFVFPVFIVSPEKRICSHSKLSSSSKC